MRIWLLILFLAFPIFSSFSHNYIEIDLNKKEAQLVDFYLGDIPVNGIFSFDSKEEDGSLIFTAEGRDLFFGKINIDWAKLKITARGDDVFIDYLRFPGISINGNMNLLTQNISLTIEGSLGDEVISFGGSRIAGKVDVWGNIDHLFTTGLVTVEDGVYEGMHYSSAEFSFIGSPPVLSITDSRIMLVDGSIFQADGVIDLRNLEDMLPYSEFTTQELHIGDWGTLPRDDKGVGLKKNVDEKVDVLFSAKESEYDDTLVDAGAEMRYKMGGDKFLKLRVEDEETIIGFEKRMDF